MRLGPGGVCALGRLWRDNSVASVFQQIRGPGQAFKDSLNNVPEAWQHAMPVLHRYSTALVLALWFPMMLLRRMGSNERDRCALKHGVRPVACLPAHRMDNPSPNGGPIHHSVYMSKSSS